MVNGKLFRSQLRLGTRRLGVGMEAKASGQVGFCARYENIRPRQHSDFYFRSSYKWNFKRCLEFLGDLPLASSIQLHFWGAVLFPIAKPEVKE